VKVESAISSQPSSQERPSPSKPIGLIGIIAGAGIAATGLTGAALSLVGIQTTSGIGGISTAFLSQAATIGALALILGGILVAEGLRLRRGVPPAPFRTQRLWLLWAVFLTLWVTGTVLSFLDGIPSYLTVPVHALTLMLLPLLILSVVGWTLQGRGGSWSDVGNGLISGAVLGTSMAAAAEITLLALVAFLLLATGAFPQEWLQQAPQALISGESPLPAEIDTLLELLNPTIVLIGLAFIGGAVPLIEEVTKTLGVGLAGLWLRPSPARAFLLGVASGAGFALAENALNVAYGPAWGVGIGVRLAATVMHCATGGLMGWGWGQWWAGRRPWRLPLAFITAVAIHGLWNTIAVGMALSGLTTLARADQPVWVALGGLLTLALGTLEVLLAVAVTAALLWAGYRLGRGE